MARSTGPPRPPLPPPLLPLLLPLILLLHHPSLALAGDEQGHVGGGDGGGGEAKRRGGGGGGGGGMAQLDGYDYSIIHEEILKDRTRTEAYKSAILDNPDAFVGKIVADLGCGLGLMSLFAARAGAKKVYCIEAAEIADVARDIVRANGLEGTIEIVKTLYEDAFIPEGYVDVIISEWMGFFLFFEDMLPGVLDFRDKYLVPGGRILPSKARLWSSYYEDEHWYESRIRYWENVYGFNYTTIVNKVKSEQFRVPQRQHLRSNGMISTQTRLAEIDLRSVRQDDLERIFVSAKNKITRNATIHGICFWFDVLLDGPQHQQWLDTSPRSGYNSWSQVIWYFIDPQKVRKDDVVEGFFTMLRTEKGEFDVTMEILKPFKMTMEAWEQSPNTMYQDLYERLEYENAIYRNRPSSDYAVMLLRVLVSILTLFLGGWLGRKGF